MRASVSCQLYFMKMLSIAAGFQLILSCAIMVVVECCSLTEEVGHGHVTYVRK